MIRRQFKHLALMLSVAAITISATPALADPPSLLKAFGRTSTSQTLNKKLELSEVDGPWMILAATFVGETSRERAEKLAMEIRREMNMPAFIYHETFDFTGGLNGSATDSRKMRYANQYQYHAHAVLVGEYASVDNKQIDADLARIKSARPKFYEDPSEHAAASDMSTPVATVKAISRKLLKLRDEKTNGPMANAFVTRNPMLPEDYFQSPQVDSFVKQMNEGLSHSLLDCPGKYTVVVATFEGLSTIVDGRHDKKFTESADRMDKFARDAAKMAAALRNDGVEAYQFHDRNRSVVTVGSFETLGRELPDGQFEYAPEIRATMREYSALNSKKARVVPGKNGIAANHVAMIPFDVQPTPIAVPKVSRRSLYSGKLGMN